MNYSGDRKKKREEVGKGEWETEDLHRPNGGECDYANKSERSLDIGSRQRIQIPKEAPAKGVQPQGLTAQPLSIWVRNSLQLLLTATYLAIVQLGSVLEMLRDKTDN